MICTFQRVCEHTRHRGSRARYHHIHDHRWLRCHDLCLQRPEERSEGEEGGRQASFENRKQTGMQYNYSNKEIFCL